MANKTPDPTDVYVGKRLRMQRMVRGLSQTALGDHLGVTFQQIQKYEKGANRIAPSRLQEAARFLQMPVSYFFDGGPKHNSDDAAPDELPTDLLQRADSLSMAKAFAGIDDRETRHHLMALTRRIAKLLNGTHVKAARHK